MSKHPRGIIHIAWDVFCIPCRGIKTRINNSPPPLFLEVASSEQPFASLLAAVSCQPSRGTLLEAASSKLPPRGSLLDAASAKYILHDTHSIQYTAHGAQYTVHSVQYTVYNIVRQWALSRTSSPMSSCSSGEVCKTMRAQQMCGHLGSSRVTLRRSVHGSGA